MTFGFSTLDGSLLELHENSAESLVETKISFFRKINSEYCFIGKTDEENSLVCLTNDVPSNVIEREDGWKAFRIQGVLDFSLVYILSKISSILAEQKVGIFAISTFNTDYILTKKENYQDALKILSNAGYTVVS